MSFSAYSKYKESGIDWIGRVPDHWCIDRLKVSVGNARNGIWGEEADGGATDIPCVRVADFDRRKLRAVLHEPTLRKITYKEQTGRVLKKGDLLLEKSGGGEGQPVGCVVLYDDDRPAICSNFVAKVELASGMNSSFWRYVHAAAYSIRLTTCSINQTSGIQNLDQAAYFNERVAFPPQGEQASIAVFLDRETDTIDELIKEKERLIELLREKRKSTISHAVTLGLDTSAPISHTGIDWLGDAPSHWKMKRVKHVIIKLDQGWSPQCESSPVESEEDWGVLKVGCVNGGLFRPTENKTLPIELSPLPELSVVAGDLMISRANTRELVGSAAVAVRSYPRLMICDKLFRLRLDEAACNPKYLLYFLCSGHVRSQIELGASGASSSMQNISQSTILELPIALPPISEQLMIISHIDAELAEIDLLSEQSARSIGFFMERRTALISAAVTGKIDVRGLA